MILISLSSFSQERTPATAEQQQMMETKIAEAAAEMHKMSCDFEQIKKSALFNEDAVSRGKMTYQAGENQADKPNPKKMYLRWEYVDGYTFLMDDGQIALLSAEGKPIQNMKMSRIFEEIFNLMFIGLNGGTVNVDKSKFAISYFIEKKRWKMVLVPLKREMKNFFSSVEIEFNPDNAMADKIEIIETQGDKTIIKLINRKINN